MAEERNWKRIRERLALQLPVRINCRETPDFEWSEVTRLINVTPFGAGFTLKRPTERGRLLHMTIPMPRQLRVYDHVEDQYRIWGIVRYLRGRSSPQATGFEVGVAFIGKRPPASYESQPWKRYEISTDIVEKLAVVDETPDAALRGHTSEHTRHNIAVDMRVELVDVNGAVVASEQTVTENISSEGATLFTTLDLAVGRLIRLTSDQYRVSAFAAIRSRTTGADGVPRIHVEFVDRQWPL
jgi:hypothetical protein